MFSWLRARRRRAIRERPFPPAWNEVLLRLVRQVEWLDEEQRERLRGWVSVFLAEKRFEGCRGMAITDEVRLAIAGQAPEWADFLAGHATGTPRTFRPRAAPAAACAAMYDRYRRLVALHGSLETAVG